ncbi:MAG: DUF2442 domain-containing protein [Clostridiales bacterium]|jgi:hypothetical protein|nr:DUF2442 domain-containing protein [Clostridiales bacterium]
MPIRQYPVLLSAKALSDFKLELDYNNGDKRIYNFKPNLTHPFYKELSIPSLFKSVQVIDGEICWPTGQDFCPHTLYDDSILLSN